MSCVQIFYRDRMVAVSHLIGTDTVPEDNMKEVRVSTYIYISGIDTRQHSYIAVDMSTATVST
jgi:hypothetical protein